MVYIIGYEYHDERNRKKEKIPLSFQVMDFRRLIHEKATQHIRENNILALKKLFDSSVRHGNVEFYLDPVKQFDIRKDLWDHCNIEDLYSFKEMAFLPRFYEKGITFRGGTPTETDPFGLKGPWTTLKTETTERKSFERLDFDFNKLNKLSVDTRLIAYQLRLMIIAVVISSFAENGNGSETISLTRLNRGSDQDQTIQKLFIQEHYHFYLAVYGTAFSLANQDYFRSETEWLDFFGCYDEFQRKHFDIILDTKKLIGKFLNVTNNFDRTTDISEYYTPKGRSLLHEAIDCYDENPQILNCFLELNMNPFVYGDDGMQEPPLLYAIKNNKLSILKEIVSHYGGMLSFLKALDKSGVELMKCELGKDAHCFIKEYKNQMIKGVWELLEKPKITAAESRLKLARDGKAQIIAYTTVLLMYDEFYELIKKAMPSLVGLEKKHIIALNWVSSSKYNVFNEVFFDYGMKLGALHLKYGSHTEAFKHFKRANELFPKKPYILLPLIRASLGAAAEQKDWRESDKILEESLLSLNETRELFKKKQPSGKNKKGKEFDWIDRMARASPSTVLYEIKLEKYESESDKLLNGILEGLYIKKSNDKNQQNEGLDWADRSDFNCLDSSDASMEVEKLLKDLRNKKLEILNKELFKQVERVSLSDTVEESVFEELLKKGANINAQDAHLNTPLHYLLAKRVKCHSLIAYFIKNDADITAMNELGEMPSNDLMNIPEFMAETLKALNEGLIDAAINGDSLKVQVFLIKHGANICYEQEKNYTPLVAASALGNLKVVKTLLFLRKNIPCDNSKAQYIKELTESLKRAFQNNRKEVLEYLLAEVVNIQNFSSSAMGQLIGLLNTKIENKEIKSDPSKIECVKLLNQAKKCLEKEENKIRWALTVRGFDIFGMFSQGMSNMLPKDSVVRPLVNVALHFFGPTPAPAAPFTPPINDHFSSISSAPPVESDFSPCPRE